MHTIVLCCAVCACAAAAAAQTPPSIAPPPQPSATEQSTPPAAAAAAPAAPVEAQPADVDPDAAEQSPAPEEAAAPDEAAAAGGQPAETVKPSAVATPTTELHRTPERFGGLPAADSTPPAPSRPRLNVEKAIGVTTMRIVKDDGSAAGAGRPAQCEVQILHDKPAGKTREVATLKVDGAPAQHEDILSLLKRRACEAGANAVLIESMGKTRVEGVKVDHVEAVALIVGTPKPPVDPSPVPKTITVTPEGPAVPKTITVDPGASP